MDTILILGGTGFIGKNIVESFKNDDNCKLVVVSRDLNLIDNAIFSADSISVELGSFSDPVFIENLIVEYDVTIIIHLISNLIPSSSATEFYEGMNDFIIPTFRLIDFIANKNIKFMFFSSGGTIYGNSDAVINEETPLNPINNYGFTKLIVENYIRFKSNSSQLDYIIVRPSNVYGKYQLFDRNQGFISVAINKIQNNLPIEIWGDGNTIRDYIDVFDVVSIVRKLLYSSISNVTLNLSTGVGFSLLEMIQIIEANLGKKSIVHFNTKRIVDANKVILDNTKLLDIVDHEFIGVSEGIKHQIKYYNTTISSAK